MGVCFGLFKKPIPGSVAVTDYYHCRIVRVTGGTYQRRKVSLISGILWKKWEPVLSMRSARVHKSGGCILHTAFCNPSRKFSGWFHSGHKMSRHHVVGKHWNFYFTFFLMTKCKTVVTCLFGVHLSLWWNVNSNILSLLCCFLIIKFCEFVVYSGFKFLPSDLQIFTCPRICALCFILNSIFWRTEVFKYHKT